MNRLNSTAIVLALGLPLAALAQPPTNENNGRIIQVDESLVVCEPVPPIEEHLGPGVWITLCMPVVPAPRQCIETLRKLDCTTPTSKSLKGA